MKHNQFITTIKSVEDDNKIITMCGSTEVVDRTGDIIKMSGVDLTNYLKNPVILFNHDYDKIIGKALEVEVIDSKLIFKIQFADTKLGNEVYYLLKNGYMNASSIGFIGKEYEGNEHGGLTFTKIELLELSIVSVPCNPTALIQLRKDFKDNKISKAIFEELGGNMKTSKKEFTQDNIDAIKKAIELLASIIEETEEQEDTETSTEEENEEITADTSKEDETDDNISEEEDKPEEKNKKSYTHEEIIKEILKNLGGK